MPIWVVLSTVCAALVFLNGGIYITHSDGFFELSDFGWFLVPLAYILFSNATWRKKIADQITTLDKSFDKKPKQAFAVLAISYLAVCANHLAGVINRYLSFKADWDLAIYANACANDMYSSLRDQTTLMADHFEPFLYLFTPLCERFDPATVLLIIQVICFVIGGVGVYIFARHVKLGFCKSLLLSLIYLNFSGNITTLKYDFHLLALAMGSIPWLCYFAYAKRWLAFFLLAICHVALKETACLGLGGLGLFMMLRQRKAAGAITVIASFIMFVLIMKFAFPYFREGRESQYFAKYYAYLGSSVEAVIMRAITDPLYVLGRILTYERIRYLVIINLPFLFLPILIPSLWLPALPTIAVNILSSVRSMHGGGFHYQAEIYPFFFCALLWVMHDPKTAQRINALCRKLRVPMQPVTLWIIFLMCCFSGKGLGWYSKVYQPTPYQRHLEQVLDDQIDDLEGRQVAAIEKVATHLASLRNLYLLDERDLADTMVIAYPQKKLWQIQKDEIENSIIPKLDQTWSLSFQDKHYPDIRIFQKH